MNTLTFVIFVNNPSLDTPGSASAGTPVDSDQTRDVLKLMLVSKIGIMSEYDVPGERTIPIVRPELRVIKEGGRKHPVAESAKNMVDVRNTTKPVRCTPHRALTTQGVGLDRNTCQSNNTSDHPNNEYKQGIKRKCNLFKINMKLS